MFFLFLNCFRKKTIEIFFLNASMFFLISETMALKVQINWLYWSLILIVFACFMIEKTKLEMFLWFFTSFKKYFFFENFWRAKITDCRNFLMKISHQWSVLSSKKRSVCFFKSLRFSMYHIWIVSRKQVDRLVLIVSISDVIIAFFIFFTNMNTFR